jgi:hypothetical protein
VRERRASAPAPVLWLARGFLLSEDEMRLWEYKPGEWVNLDQVVKVVCNAQVAKEVPYLWSLRTGERTLDPKRGQIREGPKVTLHMSNSTFVPVEDPMAIAELAILLKPMLLKTESPNSLPSLEDDSRRTQSP